MPRLTVIAAALVAIAAISALAVSAVYVNEGGERNVAGPGGSSASAPSEAAPAGDNLAAFVVHAEPKELGEAAFLTKDGTPVTLADWRGKVVLLNLWATWCAPCRHEMPALDRLQAELGGDGFEVVAVSLDRGGAEKSRAFFDEIGVEHLALYYDTTMKISSGLGIIGMPTTLLIDAEGREIGRLTGPAEWDSPEAIEMITRRGGLAQKS